MERSDAIQQAILGLASVVKSNLRGLHVDKYIDHNDIVCIKIIGNDDCPEFELLEIIDDVSRCTARLRSIGGLIRIESCRQKAVLTSDNFYLVDKSDWEERVVRFIVWTGIRAFEEEHSEVDKILETLVQ